MLSLDDQTRQQNCTTSPFSCPDHSPADAASSRAGGRRGMDPATRDNQSPAYPMQGKLHSIAVCNQRMNTLTKYVYLYCCQMELSGYLL